MFCSQCGTQLDNSATFCPSCGNGVAASGWGAATNDDKEPVQDIAAPRITGSKRKTSFIEWIGIVFGGLIGLLVLALWLSVDSSNATSSSGRAASTRVEAVSPTVATPITDEDYFKCVTLLNITTSADALQLLDIIVQNVYRASVSDDPIVNMTAGIEKLNNGVTAETGRWKDIGMENWLPEAEAACDKVGIARK